MMTGNELAARRLRCGLTQEQLAQYLGIGRTSVWRMENRCDYVPRAVEISSCTLEPGNRAFRAWVAGLPIKKRAMVKRRQMNFKVNEPFGCHST
jgi:predicted DNA-binding transcriptional regulator AlpA